MEITRGDLVIAVMPGDYGKPRPVLVVQGDAFAGLPSATVLPLTSDLRNAPLVRITIEPTVENGLEQRSQLMVDKAATVDRGRIRQRIGQVDMATMLATNAALGRFLGLG